MIFTTFLNELGINQPKRARYLATERGGISMGWTYVRIRLYLLFLISRRHGKNRRAGWGVYIDPGTGAYRP